MIWADRVGLVWVAIIAGLMLVTGATFNSTTAALVWLATPWFLMRAIDFIFTGCVRYLARDHTHGDRLWPGGQQGLTLWDRRR